MQILLNAEKFFVAYQVLKADEELSMMLMTPGIVCLSFSIELYMKYLLALTGKTPPRDHRILILFQSLPPKIQDEIYKKINGEEMQFSVGNIFGTKRFNKDYSFHDAFLEDIEKISDSFCKWRYSHEKTTVSFPTSFAEAFVIVLRDVGEDLQTPQNT